MAEIELENRQLLTDYLRENAWRYFCRHNILTGAVVLEVHYTNGIDEATIAEFLKRYCSNQKSSILYQLNVDQSLDLRLNTDKIYDRGFNPHLGEITYLGVTISQFLGSFVQGYVFCSVISLGMNRRNLLLIKHLFVPPIGFETVIDKVQKHRLIHLVGEPKSGKTYSAYYLLHHFRFEWNASIFYCVGAKNFSRFIDGALKFKDYDKNQLKVIYYEDPFGFSAFDIDQTEELFNDLGKLHGLSNVKVIISSRSELFASAVHRMPRSAVQEMKSAILVKYSGKSLQDKFISERFSLCEDEISVYYGKEETKRVVGNIAWLYGAKWHSQFASFLERPNDDWIWDKIDFQGLSPGSIYEAFLIFISLRSYHPVHDFNSIRKSLFLGSSDLVSAFNSEVNVFMTREEGVYIRLFFLLPAFTSVRSVDEIKTIFGKYYNKVFPYIDLLTEPTESGPFSRATVRYYHPSFAEAVRNFLIKYGYSQLLSKSPEANALMQFVYNSDVSYEFLRDFICFVYFLQAVGRGRKKGKYKENSGYKITLESLERKLAKSNREDLIVEQKIVKFFYNALLYTTTKKIQRDNVQSFITDKLLTKDKGTRWISYAGSVLEHQILSSVGENRIDQLGNVIVGFIGAIAELIETKGQETKIVASIFLHVVFSNLEDVVKSDIDEDDILKSVDSLIDHIGIRYVESNSQKDRGFYRDIGVIWLDALLMKFGELHVYLSDNEGFVTQLAKLSPEETSINERVVFDQHMALVKRCLLIREHLFNRFKQLFSELSSQNHGQFLRGAVCFSLIWHNRWKYQSGYNEFQNWLREERLNPVSEIDDEYALGFLSNVKYHYDYFLAKNETWQRENAILIWKMGSPRKGADAVYEAGITEEDFDSESVIDSIVFEKMLNTILERPSLTEYWLPLVYLIGLRYERDSDRFQTAADIAKDSLDRMEDSLVKRLIKDLEYCGLNRLRAFLGK